MVWYFVVDLKSGRTEKARLYATRAWCLRRCVKLQAIADHNKYEAEYVPMTHEEYKAREDELNPLVEVKNMMSGLPVKIRKADVGSCVDPSTETYWSM